MIRLSTLLTAFALTGIVTSTSVAAQNEPARPLVFTVDAAVAHQSETDLTDTAGAFSLDRWFVGAGVTYVWDQRTSLGISVGGGKSNYEFGDLTTIGGGTPWENIDETRVSVTWQFGFGEKGGVFLVPTVRSNAENGAGDSNTYGLYAALAWRLSDKLTIGPGIGVFTRLEDSTRVFPILAIDWDISERWKLSTGRGLAASRGPGLSLDYKLTENWTLGLAGRYEDLEFRLDDKNTQPGGVGRDQSFPLVFTATLKPTPRFTVAMFAGVEMAGTLDLKNAQGDTIEETDYDPAPIFGATFDIRF